MTTTPEKPPRLDRFESWNGSADGRVPSTQSPPSSEPDFLKASPPSPPTGKLVPAPRVFYPAAGLLVLFVAITALFPDRVGDLIGRANASVVQDLAWWYIAVVASFIFFCVWIAASHMGNIVLGKDGDQPEFSRGSWFAMLFAAGMGIGLVFWGVAEPLSHYAATPPGMPGADQAERARTALNVTFLHWGLHAWAIYAVVGLAVGYSVHRLGNPISLRWTLRPLLGDRVQGFWGDVIDVVAVLGTLFGIATSLGLGVSQIGAGLGYLDVIDQPSTWLLVVLIICITAIAVVSVVTGIGKGMKWLSNINLLLAVGLMSALLILGPTVFILSDLTTQVGSYVQNFVQLSFNGMPFEEDGKQWLGGWTTFYWGWWMSWAPFVGVFIARISKGRTIREFIVGVLLVPTLVTFLWFSVMGGTALHQEVLGSGGLIAEDGSVSATTALFQLINEVAPSIAVLLSIVAILLVVIFFVTSADSGALVVTMLASGGNPDPPLWARTFWAILEGAIAAVLLIAGASIAGADPLSALQTMAILLALPFSVVMLLMCAATAKALLIENRFRMRKQRAWLAEQIVQEMQNRGS
ncbi:BCCT family transporter [Hoyosella altamirensis]|uniref:Choline/glycine/proline betaine transport protein n=1 Tax=Hoyosella altamirensis TaxID=616997 RepID=A0A839RSS5_9ACTN|nr:BCCT family transporter [Hoyosella altamirensis]MBB3039206.1 choline/glycine/proline betaine transport protein [Hoyosella altamirensis]